MCWGRARGPGLYSRRGSEMPARSRGAGGVAERLKAPVLKTGMGASPRGFESLPLRHSAWHASTARCVDKGWARPEDETLRGEVAESAEGNRLLSGYRVLSLVPGSNPGLSATFRGRLDAPIAQLDRASDYESEGRRFESCWAHHDGRPPRGHTRPGPPIIDRDAAPSRPTRLGCVPRLHGGHDLRAIRGADALRVAHRRPDDAGRAMGRLRSGAGE
jgi:hypothetical protein